MYTPRHYRVPDPDGTLARLVREHPFAALVTDGPEVTHLPFVLHVGAGADRPADPASFGPSSGGGLQRPESQEGRPAGSPAVGGRGPGAGFDPGRRVLESHLARANPHSRSLDGRRAVVIVSGPDAYVSPTWYREPDVPTWNYVAAHVTGTIAFLPDPRPVLARMAEAFGDAAAVAALDPAHVEQLSRQIIAFELRIEQVEVKAKLSQNRDPADRDAVAAALAASDDPGARAVAAWMR